MEDNDLVMYPLVFFVTGIWCWNALIWLTIVGVL